MEIIINGVTLQGDFMDANFVGPYEEATYKMQKKAAECQAKKYTSFAESIREQCATVDEYFDDIFGEGTSARVFEGAETQLMVHLKAVEDLTNWAQGERKKLNDFTNKYTQRQNAAVKRQQAQAQQFLDRKNGGRRH